MISQLVVLCGSMYKITFLAQNYIWSFLKLSEKLSNKNALKNDFSKKKHIGGVFLAGGVKNGLKGCFVEKNWETLCYALCNVYFYIQSTHCMQIWSFDRLGLKQL